MATGITLQKCVDFLPVKSFNTFGHVVLTLFASILITIIIISSTSGYSETSVQCSKDSISKSKTTEDKSIINLKCSQKYQDKLDFTLPVNVMFTLNFGIVFVLSIVYGYLVKHRVEKFDYQSGTATTINADEENRAMLPPPSTGQNRRESRECLGHFSTFGIYIVHLFIARILPLLVFAIWFFYPARIPNNFPCPWQSDMQEKGTSSFNNTLNAQSNSTIIDCINPMGSKSKTLVDAVATVDVIFVTLSFVELGYIAWLTFNDRDFMTDQEFCMVYLMRKRKGIRKLVNEIRENFNEEILEDAFGDDIPLGSLEEIYVNVVIQEGTEQRNAYPREFDRDEIFKAHLKTLSTKLESTADIFKPKNQRYPRSILVIGRPGIGKTMLTRKLLHQWKVQEGKFWNDKIVILFQFRKFNKTVTRREMLGCGVGLIVEDFETVYKFILSNPTNIILVFDGLDELIVDSEVLCANSVSTPNEKMPMSSIFSMLVDGRSLPGITVLATSRPTAKFFELYRNLKFERTVEILGFFEEQIKEYVFKYCLNNDDTSQLIWKQIKGSAELLSLCYVPVNSYIVCLTLKESIEMDESGQQVCESPHSNVPNTITELYKRAIKVLLYRHHPKYKLKQRPNDYHILRFPTELEEDLSKLKEVAKNGIDEGRLIFERTTDDKFGDLENCGLFHKLPDKQRNFFCFLHLTLQEFLAASKVVDDMENVEQFLRTHLHDPKWHLVIQFVAGLVGDKIRETNKSKKSIANLKESKRNQHFLDTILERLEEWAMKLGTGSEENKIALLGIKCLYEMQEFDFMKSVSNKFVAKGDGVLRLNNLNIAPVDSTALFEFLGNCKNLKQLEFHNCQIWGKYSYAKMVNSLLDNPANAIESCSLDREIQSMC